MHSDFGIKDDFLFQNRLSFFGILVKLESNVFKKELLKGFETFYREKEEGRIRCLENFLAKEEVEIRKTNEKPYLNFCETLDGYHRKMLKKIRRNRFYLVPIALFLNVKYQNNLNENYAEFLRKSEKKARLLKICDEGVKSYFATFSYVINNFLFTVLDEKISKLLLRFALSC